MGLTTEARKVKGLARVKGAERERRELFGGEGGVEMAAVPLF